MKRIYWNNTYLFEHQSLRKRGEEPCSGTHFHFTNEIDPESFSVRKIESKGWRIKVGYDAKPKI